MKAVSLFLIGLCLLLGGCASTRTQVVEKGRSLRTTKHYFVLRNLQDNFGVAERIVRALQARGLDASLGPITLLPDSAQAVVMYEDRWAWDFSTHLVYLKISVRDPQGVQPFATVSYQKSVGFSTRIDEVVAQLVDKLLKTAK